MYLAIRYSDCKYEDGSSDILGLFSSLEKADQAIQRYLNNPVIFNKKPEVKITMSKYVVRYKLECYKSEYDYIEVVSIDLNEELCV